MASGKTGRTRSAAEERERARRYQARQDLHTARGRRRVRDNWIGGVVAAVIVLGAIGSQALYYSVGPGAPEPAPTDTATPVPSPTETGAPTETPAPTQDPTGDPTPNPTPSS